MKLAFTIFCFLYCLVTYGQTVNDLRPTVTMKEYVDNNIEWSQKYNAAQLASLEKAQELVRLSLQEYKTVNNEWRGQLKDQAGTFVTRSELWTAVIAIISLVIGAIGLMRKQQQQKAEGKNIKSGDVVEVNKNV